jgi:hypothetical protein
LKRGLGQARAKAPKDIDLGKGGGLRQNKIPRMLGRPGMPKVQIAAGTLHGENAKVHERKTNAKQLQNKCKINAKQMQNKCKTIANKCNINAKQMQNKCETNAK